MSSFSNPRTLLYYLVLAVSAARQFWVNTPWKYIVLCVCTKIVSVCWENRTNENERTLLYFEPCSCCHCPEQTFVYSKTSKLQKKKKSKTQRHKGYCIICSYSRFWMEVQSQQRLATTWTMETSGQSWFLVHLETNNCNQEENITLFDDNHKMQRSNSFCVWNNCGKKWTTVAVDSIPMKIDFRPYKTFL